MFKTLRGRLLFSYLVIIGTVLVLLALGLLILSVAPGAARLRILPTLQRLRTLSISTEREIDARLQQQGSLQEEDRREALQRVLEETAADHDVRVLLVSTVRRAIVYDSQPGGEWIGRPLRDVQRMARLFPDLNPALPVGRWRGPDGSSWIVYGQRIAASGVERLLLVFAVPEMGGFQFFRNNFLPLLWRAGAAALLLSLVLAFIISRSVARPLQELAAAADAVARGDYEHQAPLRGPHDVQRVARSFNSMAERVKRTQQSQRDFLANVSHDLKTPLTAIQGWSQALEDRTADDPQEQQRAAEIIRAEARRMSRMVQKLLMLARIDSGELDLQKEWIDVSQLLADVKRNLALRAQKKKIQITQEQALVPPLWGDRDRLMQVFANLLDNALTHTPVGGRVHVKVQPDGREGLEVTVQDTGPGIAEEELSRVFERFYQVEKSRARPDEAPGYGLGLAITRELVEAHKGQISVQSVAGEGTRFTVRLPLSRVTQSGEHR